MAGKPTIQARLQAALKSATSTQPASVTLTPMEWILLGAEMTSVAPGVQTLAAFVTKEAAKQPGYSGLDDEIVLPLYPETIKALLKAIEVRRRVR